MRKICVNGDCITLSWSLSPWFFKYIHSEAGLAWLHHRTVAEAIEEMQRVNRNIDGEPHVVDIATVWAPSEQQVKYAAQRIIQFLQQFSSKDKVDIL